MAETFAAAMGLDFTEHTAAGGAAGGGGGGGAHSQEYPETNNAKGGGEGGGSHGQQPGKFLDVEIPKDEKKSWWGAKK